MPNIQDSCVVDGFPNSVTMIQKYGHIGHGAILHGCYIGKNVLVGMNSVILDLAEIGENTIIGANSLVKTKDIIPSNVLVIGSPAKVVRELTKQEKIWKNKGTKEYIALAQRSLSSLQHVEPHTTLEEHRLDYRSFKGGIVSSKIKIFVRLPLIDSRLSSRNSMFFSLRVLFDASNDNYCPLTNSI